MVKAYPPTRCDVCGQDLKSGETYFDASIPGPPYHGRWGWACSDCAETRTILTGPGVGQEYDSETDEKIRG
jgi:hypothetical protein